MSLINEVLSQIDHRSSMPVKPLPLQALMVDKKKVNYIKIIFFIIIFMLVILISMQWYYQSSLIDLVFSSTDKENRRYDVYESDSSIVETNVKGKADIFETVEVSIKNENPIKVNEEISELIVKNTGKSNTLPLTIESPSLPIAETTKLSNEIVKINPVLIPGLKQYKLALKAYKKKKNTLALHWVDLAIEEDMSERYLLLKARIYIQKNDADGFYNFVLNNSDNHSLSWYQLIAPGLQMFSYHQLSNKYYEKLVKNQPRQVKWKLAMALNYSKLGAFDKRQAIYQSLLESSLLSSKQRQWLVSQVSSFSRKKERD